MAAISTLQDGFQDNTLNTGLWTTGWDQFAAAGATIAETGQQTNVTLLGSTSGNNYIGRISVSAYDLTGDRCFVKGPTVPVATSGAEMHYALFLDANNSIRCITDGPTFHVRTIVAGTPTDVLTNPYDPTLYTWLSFTESGGTTTAWGAPATASNPPILGDWISISSFANPFAITALKAVIGGGTYTSVATPGNAIFDGFNVATTSTAGDVGGFCLHESEWHPTEPQTNPLTVSVWG